MAEEEVKEAGQPSSRVAENIAEAPAPAAAPEVAAPVAVESAPAQPTATAAPAAMKYAGFWIRFVAYLIDTIMLGIVLGVILMLTGQISTSSNTTLPTAVGIMSAILIWAYFVILDVCCGATLGKMVFGLKVVDTSGTKLSWGKAILREVVGKIVSSIVIDLGYLWVAFDPNKQGWHDKIAQTFVIKK